jgi:hypothetical protein
LFWIQKKTGTDHGCCFTLNGLYLTFSFVLFRAGGFLWMGYKLYIVRQQFFSLATYRYVTIAFCYLTGLTMQLMWSKKLVTGCIKTLRGGKTKGR